MKKSIALLLVLVLVLSVGLTACGKTANNAENVQPEEPATAESLMKGYLEKTASGTGMVYDTDMSMKMSMKVMGQSQTMEMTSVTRTESAGNISHLKGTSVTLSDGEKQTEETEIYSVKDGKTITTYVLVDGKWYKQTSDSELTGSLESMVWNIDYSGLTLSEEGNEYVLKGTISVNELMGVLQEYMGGLSDMGDLSSLDLSSAPPVAVEYRFDKSTRNAVSCSMDMKDCMRDIMEKVMKALIEAFAQMGGEDGENPLAGIDISSLINIEISETILKISNISFDPALKIELPEAAKGAAEITSGD